MMGVPIRPTPMIPTVLMLLHLSGMSIRSLVLTDDVHQRGLTLLLHDIDGTPDRRADVVRIRDRPFPVPAEGLRNAGKIWRGIVQFHSQIRVFDRRAPHPRHPFL